MTARVRRFLSLVLLAIAFGACAALASPAAAGTAYSGPVGEDLSGLSWTEAFDALHAKISREYAFTGWKHIAWPALAAKYRPAIAKAQAAGDAQAYYLTLCRFIHELRDGHASTAAFDAGAQQVVDAAMQELAGGGFGLVATRLESGGVVASWLQPDGPAARAGVTAGARIVAWGGRPVEAALTRTSTALSPSQATNGRRDRERLRFLVRAPVGTVKTLTFRNRGAGAPRTVRLRALDDDFVTLDRTDERSILAHGWPEKLVVHEILPGNVGYVRLYLETDLPAEQSGDHTPTLELFRSAMDDFIDAGVAGLIVDIRGNSGGVDQTSADILGSFFAPPALYEYSDVFNTVTGSFEIWRLDPLTAAPIAAGEGIWIEPVARRYAGPVVALVDNGCLSSGEGLAMGIKRLPNGRVAGFHGTNGSFGMAGDIVLMPLDIEVKWPFGRSLDARKVVQIDARNGRGGVTPNVRVPMTWTNVLRQSRGRDVVLEYGLRALEEMRAR